MPKSKAIPATTAKCIGVTVLKRERRYSMYELLEIGPEGAFLGGKLLLEPGEALTLELAFDDSGRAVLEAQVASADDGERPGIRVTWNGLSAANRALLSNQ